jgi:hypothetical protein
MNPIFLQSQDLYPKADINVEVSSGEDDVPKPDALMTRQKTSAGDDAEDGGASSAEPIAPNPTSSNVLEQTDPFVADRAGSTNPSASERRPKRPLPAPKQKQVLPLADQVISQIELPPHRGLRVH